MSDVASAEIRSILEPRRVRKKPIEVEAMRVGPSSDEAHAAYLWAESYVGSYDCTQDPTPGRGVSIDPADGRVVVATLEGEMRANLGDWLIRGVEGEFYPVKPDIFDQSYDFVTGDDPEIGEITATVRVVPVLDEDEFEQLITAAVERATSRVKAAVEEASRG